MGNRRGLVSALCGHSTLAILSRLCGAGFFAGVARLATLWTAGTANSVAGAGMTHPTARTEAVRARLRLWLIVMTSIPTFLKNNLPAVH